MEIHAHFPSTNQTPTGNFSLSNPIEILSAEGPWNILTQTRVKKIKRDVYDYQNLPKMILFLKCTLKVSFLYVCDKIKIRSMLN